MKFDDTNTTMRLSEARGGWKVWIKAPGMCGYLRMGFVWKTRNGAMNAARKAFPQVTVN